MIQDGYVLSTFLIGEEHPLIPFHGWVLSVSLLSNTFMGHFGHLFVNCAANNPWHRVCLRERIPTVGERFLCVAYEGFYGDEDRGSSRARGNFSLMMVVLILRQCRTRASERLSVNILRVCARRITTTTPPPPAHYLYFVRRRDAARSLV